MGLSARAFLIIMAGLSAVLAAFAFMAMQAATSSTERTLHERLALVQVTAGRFDNFVQQTIRLTEVMIDTSGLAGNPSDPSAQALLAHSLYSYLGSTANYVVVIDSGQRGAFVYPPQAEVLGRDFSTSNCVNHAFDTGLAQVTRSFVLATPIPAVAMVVPVGGPDGQIQSAVLVSLDLNHSDFSELLRPLDLGKTGYAEVVDRLGMVLGATRPGLRWTEDDHKGFFANLIEKQESSVGTCHNCHTARDESEPLAEDVVAFAPLSSAPWGIVFRQARDEAFAYTDAIRTQAFWLGLLSVLLAAGTAWAVSRHVVYPLQTLTAACQEIANGNLAEAIPMEGPAELGALASAFSSMRDQLQALLDGAKSWSAQLEAQVRAKTAELEQSRQQLLAANQDLSRLLHLVITGQEDERRRIARELHDETSQTLTALSVGLETAIVAPAASPDEVKQRLAPLKALATGILPEIDRMIQDLRPSLLDDVGLIASVDWYAETRLAERGVEVIWETSGEDDHLPNNLETTIFRLAQEAISNVARHAEAEHASISLELGPERIVLEIEDDGKGFDPAHVFGARLDHGGHGLLGMKERVALLGGSLVLQAAPGKGTRIRAEIPIERRGDR